jgi:hypothetical protein
MQRKYRLLREAAYAQGLSEYERLARDPTFRDFVCLYIAEGYKRNRNVVDVCNSDPAVVQLLARWMRRLTTRVPEVVSSTTPIRTWMACAPSGRTSSRLPRIRSSFNVSPTATN